MVAINSLTESIVLADVYDESAHALKTTATISAADIELGAVELKDGATDNRAAVSSAGAVSVAPVATEVHVGAVGGAQLSAIATFTRPGDANDYAANDAVSNSTSAPAYLTFADIARVNGGSGYIMEAYAAHEKASVTPRLRLHLFNVAPTPINDNAALAFTYAIVGAAGYLGYVDFDAMTTNGGTDFSKSQMTKIGKTFTCASASRALYGMVQTLDIFVPGNAKGFTFKLTADVN